MTTQKTTKKSVWSPERKAKAAATRLRNGTASSKRSDSPPAARAALVKNRPARVPLMGGGRLDVPPPIVEDIRRRGCVRYLALDDKHGSLDKHLAAWWEIYEDANGQQFRIPAGSGREHVLMILPKNIQDEDQRLKRESRKNRMTSNQVVDESGSAPDYIPSGREHVLTVD